MTEKPIALLMGRSAKGYDSVTEALAVLDFEIISCTAENGLSIIASEKPINLIMYEVDHSPLPSAKIFQCLKDHAKPIAVIGWCANDDEVNRIFSLEMGADDVLQSTCSPREAVARIRAVLRRSDRERLSKRFFAASSDNKFQLSASIDGDIPIADLIFNEKKRMLRKASGKKVRLSKTQTAVLSTLLESPGKAVSRSELLAIGGEGLEISTEAQVVVMISKLRKKIAEISDKPVISTVHGIGYKVVDYTS